MTGQNSGTADETAEESFWNVADDSMNDPEEMRVIFCALDSYL
jgi:hypothetical protein